MSTLDIRTGEVTGEGEVEKIIINEVSSVEKNKNKGRGYISNFKGSNMNDLQAALDKAQELWGGK